MCKRWIAVVFIAVFALIGCASQPYEPTKRQLSLIEQFDQSKAVDIVSNAMKEIQPSTKNGLCFVSVNRDANTAYHVDRQGAHFEAWHRGEYVKQEGNQKYYKKDPYVAHFRYKEFEEVALQDNRDGSALRCSADYLITVLAKKQVMIFGLQQNNVDQLMAALIKLAPQAKLTSTKSF